LPKTSTQAADTVPDAAWYAGLDLGGTNIRAVEVDASGQTGTLLSEPLDRRSTTPFQQVIELVDRLVAHRGGRLPVAVGLGATGPVDVLRGTIDNPFTLPPAFQGDVRSAVQAALGVPLVLENDANAAAVGEAWLGAGRGAQVLACLTVGTGIGFAVLRDGQVLRGPGGSHLEGGHQVIDPAGPLCYCGARGCVESLASATAVLAAAQATGAAGTRATARDVYLAAERGDPRSQEVTRRAAAALAAAVRNVVALHGADRVVLAGGALGDVPSLLRQVRQCVDDFPFGPPGGTRVVPAELGDRAGCIGAARRAQEAVPA